MISRFFNALAWVSLILAFIVFLISYANYPDEVLVYVNSVGEPLQYLSKDLLFYTLIAFLISFNAILISLNRVLNKSAVELVLTETGISLSQLFLNLFFATSVYFISILNSRENFNYSNFGYLIYVTGGLVFFAIIFTLVSRFILKK